MVKIQRGDLDRKAFSHTLKGFYLKTWLGRTIVARSPRYGPRNNRNSVWWRNQFTIAARMAASPIWLDYEAALGLSRGTEQVPRDILMMAAYGDLFSIELPDGTVTTVADHGPPPETPPVEDEYMQAWPVFDNPWDSVPSTSAYAFKGSRFVATADMDVNGMMAIADYRNPGIYRMLIAALDASGVITEIIADSTITPNELGLNCQYFPAKGTIKAGPEYCIVVGKTDSGPTYQMRVSFTKSAQWTMPCRRTFAALIPSDNPGVGTALTASGSLACPPLGFGYKVL